VGSTPSGWWSSASGWGRQRGQEIRVVGEGQGGVAAVEVNWW
jgi:hypothetical protein